MLEQEKCKQRFNFNQIDEHIEVLQVWISSLAPQRTKKAIMALASLAFMFTLSVELTGAALGGALAIGILYLVSLRCR